MTLRGPRLMLSFVGMVVLLVALLWSGITALDSAPAASEASAAGLPLAHLVNPDGTLNLESGYVGAVDPAGWALTLDDRGRPTFVPAPLSSTGAWDTTYGAPGANMDFGGTGIFALAADSQGRIYVGGNFEIIGDLFTDNLAMWDGATWQPVGLGVNNTVRALAMDAGDNLYAGGDFTQVTNGDGTALNASRIARWDGAAWSLLGADDAFGGNGVNNSVRALALDDSGALYAGGSFITAYNASGSSVGANRVARWDGSAWTALGAGSGGAGNGVNGTVHALAVDGNRLYTGGSFTVAYNSTATSVDANRIAAWDLVDDSWSALGAGSGATGNGLNADVNALAVAANGDVYAGGAFTTAYDGGGSTVSSSFLARWNGMTWDNSLVSSGVNATVHALAFGGDLLYFGGNFNTLRLDGTSANGVGTFDTTSGAWGRLGADPNGGTPSDPIRGNGVGMLAVRVLLAAGGDVYLGGDEGPFRAYNSQSSAVGIEAVARWDGSGWHALTNDRTLGANTRAPAGSGLGIRALAVDGGGNLYVGGSFSAIGNLSANHIARWDGNGWHVLGGDSGDRGNGVGGPVYALAVDSSSNLYVGGDFRQAYSAGLETDANHVVRWDGAAWHPLGGGTGTTGNGVNAIAFALAVGADDHVYAGGQFTTAYDTVSISANHVVRWDGTTWNPLGTGSGATGNGVNNWVYALAVGGGDLFVGGQFATAYSSGGNSVAASRVARWDGDAWHALGSGLNGTVRALLSHDGDLFVGGQFSQAGGADATRIARWDGAAWSALGAGAGFDGQGVNGDVHSLGLSGDGLSLVAGGAFTSANNDTGDTVPANRLAAWDLTTGGWSAFDQGLDAIPYAVAPLADSLWIGGAFTLAGNDPSTYIARWRADARVADLSVAKSVASAAVTVGESVAYTVTVSNAGPITGTQVVLTDTLSLTAQMVISPTATQGACGATADPLWVITCDLGDVPVGESVTITYTVAPEVAGSLVNTALVAGQSPDPDVNNNVVQTTVTVEDPAAPTPTHTPTTTATPEPSELSLRRSVVAAGGGSAAGGGLRLSGTLGQSGPIGGTGTVSRTVGSGYWGATLPILRQPGGGSINWDQVDLTFPPLPPTMTVWLIPQVGSTDNLEENTAGTGISFHVEVYDQEGIPVTTFVEPYQVRVTYQESQWQNAGIDDEETITLVYYDETGETWVDTRPCTGCTLDTDANVLITMLDHATEFAVVGETASGERIFLPLLLRE